MSPTAAIKSAPFWKKTTIALLVLQFLTLPGFTLQASAQRLPDSWRRGNYPNTGYGYGTNTVSQSRLIPSGTLMKAVYPDAERIVVTPDESMDLTLQVSQNLVSSSGIVLIPAGSRIQGRLQPKDGGTQFVAQTLILQGTGQQIPINAVSRVVTRTEEIKKGTNIGGILRGAAIGAAASTIIDYVFGDRKIGMGTVLVGAAIGAGAGWALDGRKKTTVLVVDSAQDLDLTLQSNLALP
jgi:hypothetical protein